jgi:nitrile hydratase accessory protein
LIVLQTDQRIAQMHGVEELPRVNGELIFHEEWERRVFALVVALCEAGHFEWEKFRRLLIKSIKTAEDENGKNNEYQPDYYEHWLMVLEHLVLNIGIIPGEQGEAGPLSGHSAKPLNAAVKSSSNRGTN